MFVYGRLETREGISCNTLYPEESFVALTQTDVTETGLAYMIRTGVESSIHAACDWLIYILYRQPASNRTNLVGNEGHALLTEAYEQGGTRGLKQPVAP